MGNSSYQGTKLRNNRKGRKDFTPRSQRKENCTIYLCVLCITFGFFAVKNLKKDKR
jgi:hypothetical protein